MATNITNTISSIFAKSGLSTNDTTANVSIPIIDSIKKNYSIYDILKNFSNLSEIYTYQVADLIEPEEYPTRNIHIMIWTLTIFTYLLAIIVAYRMIRSNIHLNLIEYFSFHIVICSFVAWVPSGILIIYNWFETFTLKFCRLHYVIWSTNTTVPFFFVLYMVIERFLYAYPSFKQKCKQLSHMYFIYLYAIFTWLFTMLCFAIASPFIQNDSNASVTLYTKKYCAYDFRKLTAIATAQSIIYFILFIPALILLAFVLRYFYLLRGTRQIPPEEKLWTIRVLSLVSLLVFYDVYLYYLEHFSHSYQSFLSASILRSTFFLSQLLTIIFTEQYWLYLMAEYLNYCYLGIIGKRRQTLTPKPVSTEIEFSTFPYTSPSAHYALVDETVVDEFDRATNGPEPTLRVLS